MPKKKQRGRAAPPRDQQIAGEKPRLLDIPKEAQADVARYLQHIEVQAQEGYAKHGRGFLLIAHYDSVTMPVLRYVYSEDEVWSGFVNEADLAEAVQTHDPAIQYVVLEGDIDARRSLMTDIQISVWGYQYLPPTSLSA